MSLWVYPAYCVRWYFSEREVCTCRSSTFFYWIWKIKLEGIANWPYDRIEGCMWRMYLSVIQVAVMFPLADRIWMSYQSNTSCVQLVRLLNLLLVLVQTIKWPTPLSDVQWSTTWVNKNKNSKRLSLSLLFGGRERLDWQLVKKGLAKEL